MSDIVYETYIAYVLQEHVQTTKQMNAAYQMVRSFLPVPKWLITGLLITTSHAMEYQYHQL